MGDWLDWMILWGFSNLSGSVIFCFHHLSVHLHSVKAGVMGMSPVALHQNLDVAKGSGMMILQRKGGGTKKWGCKFPRYAQQLSTATPAAQELQKAGERGCAAGGLQVAGMWGRREGQAAGVLPGTLPLCMSCTFSKKVCVDPSPTSKVNDTRGTSSSLSASSPLQKQSTRSAAQAHATKSKGRCGLSTWLSTPAPALGLGQ